MTQTGDATTRVTDPSDLTDLIRTVAPRLTGALREVADTVLADPAEAARLSAVALAARAGVSQASVTRFAQSIGLASHANICSIPAASCDCPERAASSRNQAASRKTMPRAP